MANDDARYAGSFFTVYTNSRMKLHRHCLPLNDDPNKISAIYGYDRAEVDAVFRELNEELSCNVQAIRSKYGDKLDSLAQKGLVESLVCVGDQLTGDYLSYYNIIRTVMEKYPGFSSHIAGNTGDTSNQSVQYMYNLAVKFNPTIGVVFIGTNDLYRSKDPFQITVTSRKEYYENVDYIIKVLRHYGRSVVLCTLPPVDEAAAEQAYSHMNWTVDNEEIDIRNRRLREIANENGIYLCDVAQVLKDADFQVTLPNNGVLLTGDAQMRIADSLMEIMISILEKQEEV